MKPLGTLKEFTPILRETIIPHLREDGFKGSMPTFRWISSPVIQVINFQGSSGGGACYVNIGMHLDFIPVNRMEKVIEPKRINEYHCLFRKRMSWQGLLPYEKQWSYTRESAEKMIKYYLSDTRPFLHHFRRFPDAFLLLSPEDLLRGDLSSFPTANARVFDPGDVAELYVKLYEYIGDSPTAQQFSEVAEHLKQHEKEVDNNI